MKRIQIGNVSVDHGRILIIDPSCIFRASVQREVDGGGAGREGKSGLYSIERFEQLGPIRGLFQAVISHTRDGDGTYPVTAVLGDDGQLECLVIDFLDSPGTGD